MVSKPYAKYTLAWRLIKLDDRVRRRRGPTVLSAGAIPRLPEIEPARGRILSLPAGGKGRFSAAGPLFDERSR
jgi:hypothetical protein